MASSQPGAWTSAEVAGKRVEVYEPADVRFGVVHLHDADLETLRGRLAFTQLFEELKLACICPQGGPCWWADRICPVFDARLTAERFVVEHVLPFFAERFRLAPRAIAVHGIGMGGQGALRIAFKHPDRFAVAAAIAAALDYHELYSQGTLLDDMYSSKEQCRQDTALMHVPPVGYPPHIFFCIDRDDEWYRGNDRLHEKLNALGIPHTFDVATGAGGHSWEYFNLMAERALRLMHEGLVQESRRLL
jgi:S-formylglutathione hydrolase